LLAKAARSRLRRSGHHKLGDIRPLGSSAYLCFLGILNGSGHLTVVGGDVVSEVSKLKQEIGNEILV
jgi:hypothetical protein